MVSEKFLAARDVRFAGPAVVPVRGVRYPSPQMAVSSQFVF